MGISHFRVLTRAGLEDFSVSSTVGDQTHNQNHWVWILLAAFAPAHRAGVKDPACRNGSDNVTMKIPVVVTCLATRSRAKPVLLLSSSLNVRVTFLPYRSQVEVRSNKLGAKIAAQAPPSEEYFGGFRQLN
jgi:hypothetical protein